MTSLRKEKSIRLNKRKYFVILSTQIIPFATKEALRWRKVHICDKHFHAG